MPPAPETIGRSIPQFGAAIGVGRSSIYKMIARGEVRIAKIGRRTVVVDDPDEWLQARVVRHAA